MPDHDTPDLDVLEACAGLLAAYGAHDSSATMPELLCGAADGARAIRETLRLIRQARAEGARAARERDELMSANSWGARIEAITRERDELRAKVDRLVSRGIQDLRHENDDLRAVVSACHEAVGEHPASDDATLAEGISLRLSDFRVALQREERRAEKAEAKIGEIAWRAAEVATELQEAEARVKGLEGLYVRQCALTELKDERAARAEADRDEAVTLLGNLYAMVLGESPALLEGDHNGEKVAVYLAQKETR